MHFSRDALQDIWYTKHTVSVLPLKIIFVTEITKLSINLLSGQWIEQRTICYSRPRWLVHLWFDWREGTCLAQGRAVGTVSHQVQAGAVRSPRGGCQGLLLVSESWACPGSDPLGCVQHAAAPSFLHCVGGAGLCSSGGSPSVPAPQVGAVQQGTTCSLHLLVYICHSHLDLFLGPAMFLS